jgi:autotransporter translocation and assembly factor TamB
VLRTIRRIMLIISSGVVLLLVALAILHLGADTWLVNALVRGVIPGANTSVGDVAGNYFSGIRLREVRIVRDSNVVIGCDSVRANYRIRELLSNGVRIRRVELFGPVANLRQSSGGSWNPFPPGKPKAPSAPKSSPKIVIEEFSIARGLATLHPNTRPEPLALHFDATGGSLSYPRLTVQRLQAQSDSSSVVAAGAFDIPGGGRQFTLAALNLDSALLWLPDLAGIVPIPGGRARLRGSFQEDGSHKQLSLVALLLDLQLPPQPKTLSFLTPISGRIAVDLRGDRSTRFDGRAGAELFDSSGNLAASIKLSQGKADLQLDSRHRGSSIRIGGWARLFDSVPSYNLTAHLRARPSRGSLLPPNKWLGHSERGIEVRLLGRGLPPHRAFGWASARFNRPSGGPALLGSGKLDARVNGQSAAFSARTGVASGAVGLAGTASWSSRLQLRVTRGSLDQVDLATILSDSGWKALSGTFSGKLDLEAGGGMRVAVRSRLNQAGLRLTGRLGRSGSARTLDLTDIGFEHLALDKFRVSQRSMDLSGYATLRARGKTLKDAQIAGNLELRDSRFEREEISRARLTARLEHRAVLTRADINAGSGNAALSATLRPFDPEPSLRLHRTSFTDLDLGRLLHKAGLTTRLTGTVEGRAEGRSPKNARVAGTLQLDTSTINHLALDAGRIEATLDNGQLEVVSRVRSQGDSLVIGAALAPFESRPKVKLLTRVPLAPLSSLLRLNDSLKTEGAAYLALSGTLGRPDSMRLQAELQVDGRLAGVGLDSLRARLRLQQGMLEVDSLSIMSNVGVATAAGVVGLFGAAQSAPAGLRLRARLDSLAPLAPLIGMDLGLDSGRIDLAAGGTRNRLRLAGNITASGLTRGTQRLDQLAATVAARLEKDHPASATARVTARGIRTRKTSVQSIEVLGSAAGGELAVRADALIDSRSNLRTVARLRRERQGIRVQLDSLDILSNQRPWALRHPVDMLFGDSVRIDDFVLASEGHQVALNGIINRRGNQDFQVDIDGVRIQPIAHLVGADQLDGELNVSARLKGPATAPDLQAEWDVAVRSRDRDLGTVRGRAGWNGEGLRIAGRVAPQKSDSLSLKGQLPLSLSLSSDSGRGLVARIPGGKLALDVEGRVIDLRKFQPLLSPDEIRGLEGLLSVDAHAGGSLDQLNLSGAVILQKAKVQIPSTGASYKGQLKLDLAGQEARLTQARIEGGKGRMDLQGRVRLHAFPTVEFDVTSKVHQFRAFSGEQIRASLSGDLKLGGTSKAPMLSGAVRLHDTDYYLQAKNLETSAEQVELSAEDMRVLERRFGTDIAQRSRRRRILLGPWGLGLDVTLSHNTWLRRRSDPVMAVELGGKFQVRKKPGEELEVFGQIQPLVGRSFVQLMSRRFDLKSGTVTLNGPLNQAGVALLAEYSTTEAGGSTPVVIGAGVESDSGKLNITMSSRPTMSPEDIVSYLTTGRPASTDPTLKSDEQDVATMGASLAVGAALGTVAGRAGQQLGLDVVQVLQDRQGGQTLVGGKYVSPPLYLGFRQSIVPPSKTTRSTTDQQQPMEFEVEYAALQQMLVNLQGGGSDIRVFLRLRR